MSFQAGNSVSLIWKKLKKGDYTVKPFPVYKKWDLTSASSSLDYYSNNSIKIYRVLYPENNKYFGGVANISSSLYDRVLVSQSVDPKMLWYYLDNSFYTEHNKEKTPTLITDINRNTFLAQSASLMVLPRGVFGEGIRRESITLYNYSTTSSRNYTVRDDGNGNLYDSTLTTSNFVSSDNLLMYIGFNEKYREYGMTNKLVNYVLDGSHYQRNVELVYPKKVAYEDGITTNDTLESTGTSCNMYGGYLNVKNPTDFNFAKSRNFSFSFWLNTQASQSLSDDQYTSIFSKNTVLQKEIIDEQKKTISSNMTTEISNVFPFDISISNEKSSSPMKIRFQQSAGQSSVSVLSNPISSSVWNHIVCQKSSSVFQVWVNGNLIASSSWTNDANVQNNNEFYIGSNGLSSNTLVGKLDEVRVYNTYLTPTQISTLADNSFANGYAYQTNRIGNAFYKYGILVVSDPRPKYSNALLGKTGNLDYNELTDGFSGELRGTTTLYEHEVICKIRKNEFNFTQNQSIRKDGDQNSQIIEDYATGSFFNPYITTIGLYNEDYDLIAIAKLANPLNKRDDVDMNIIVRWDV